MLKDLFSNRLFIGALAFFVLCVCGSLLYMWHVERESAEYDAETQDRVAQWNEKQQPQPSAEAPVGDTTQGGHFHEDGTWHGEPHETPVETPAAPDPYFSETELAEIPEDIPEPDIPLPTDLSDSNALNRWTEKYTAEWQKYVYALDPHIERLNAEIDQMMAELPSENAPEFTVAKAKLLAKKQEHSQLRAEQNARVHKWGAASQAFADYVTKRTNAK